MSAPFIWPHHDMIYRGFDGQVLSWCSRWTSLEHKMGSDDCCIEEMYSPDEHAIEVVFVAGVPVGTINSELDHDFAKYETLEQIEVREGREEAARESYYDMLREERALERQGVI